MKSVSNKKIFRGIILTALFCATTMGMMPVLQASAYKIEKIPGDEVRGDFVVGPGKIELEIKPGESKTVNITVTNRMGDTRIFNLETEDFTGSNDTQNTVVLLGDERGPYSLKDFISYDEKSFVLNTGERAVIPVTIFIPADAEPGGRYGSVLSSTASKPNEQSSSAASAIIARIGTLFFVRIPGEVQEMGELKEFATQNEQKIFNSGPINFRMLYENTGSVHVNPYGEIRIKNILGKDIGAVEVLPWFAMPGSTRLREVAWSSGFLLGKYTAVASINRGYDNIVDTMEFSFWVVPVQLLAIICVSIAALIFIVRFIFTKFEFRRK